MTYETMIPPRSKTVLEVTGEVAPDFEDSKSAYLLIQPACKYTVTKNLDDAKGKFDTVILQSAVIGNLPKNELVETIKAAASKLNKRGTLLCTLDNFAFAENILAEVHQPLQPKCKRKFEVQFLKYRADLAALQFFWRR